jgi:hypothetical protein
MRLEDVPDEAFWSAGAAACGGRDVFFELMNEVPVDLAELEGSKDALASALACGKLLTPLMRAGASLYDIEYDVESMPSGFALLALSDDSFRDKLSYPPLSPTPTGVHRAYCSDDTGGARAACQDGARSRLLLAVNHGYIAAYAGDVPTLLDRLSRSEPPPADVAELAAFFLEPAQAEEVAVAKAGGTCGFAMDFAFVDLSPDETNRQRVLDAINDNAVLCGMQASGSVLNPTRRMLFLTKDGAAAETIRSALKRRALEVRLESGLKMPTHQEEFTKALRSAVARAGAAAKFELEGRRLAVTLSVKPNAAELQGMGKLLDARAALAKQAADVVRGLAEGKLPSASALESFRVPPSGAN